MTYKNISQFLEYNVDIQGGSKKMCILYDKNIKGLPNCFGNSLNIFSKAIQSLNCTEDNKVKDCVSCNLQNSGECLYSNQEVSCKYGKNSLTMLDFFNSYEQTKGLCESCKKLDGNILSGKPCGYLNSNYTYFFPDLYSVLKTTVSNFVFKNKSNNTSLQNNIKTANTYKFTNKSLKDRIKNYTKTLYFSSTKSFFLNSLNSPEFLFKKSTRYKNNSVYSLNTNGIEKKDFLLLKSKNKLFFTKNIKNTMFLNINIRYLNNSFNNYFNNSIDSFFQIKNTVFTTKYIEPTKKVIDFLTPSAQYKTTIYTNSNTFTKPLKTLNNSKNKYNNLFTNKKNYSYIKEKLMSIEKSIFIIESSLLNNKKFLTTNYKNSTKSLVSGVLQTKNKDNYLSKNVKNYTTITNKKINSSCFENNTFTKNQTKAKNLYNTKSFTVFKTHSINNQQNLQTTKIKDIYFKSIASTNILQTQKQSLETFENTVKTYLKSLETFENTATSLKSLEKKQSSVLPLSINYKNVKTKNVDKKPDIVIGHWNISAYKILSIGTFLLSSFIITIMLYKYILRCYQDRQRKNDIQRVEQQSNNYSMEVFS